MHFVVITLGASGTRQEIWGEGGHQGTEEDINC